MDENQIKNVKTLLNVLNIFAKACILILILLAILFIAGIFAGATNIEFPETLKMFIKWGIPLSLIAILIVVIGEYIIRKKYNL
ncbi:MAG: hypothetical protein GX362_00010 [Methanosarcinaceae archaeon]|nr:hypothetical protein [Methanosarcinaceae archaeon]